MRSFLRRMSSHVQLWESSVGIVFFMGNMHESPTVVYPTVPAMHSWCFIACSCVHSYIINASILVLLFDPHS